MVNIDLKQEVREAKKNDRGFLKDTMSREIFRQVWHDAQAVSEDDGHTDVIVNDTLIALFEAPDQLRDIFSEPRFLWVLSELPELTDNKFLEVYLAVVANGGKYKLITTSKKKKFEVTVSVSVTNYMTIAGLDDVEVEGEATVTLEVKAFNEVEAEDIAETRIREDSDDYDDFMIQHIDEV